MVGPTTPLRAAFPRRPSARRRAPGATRAGRSGRPPPREGSRPRAGAGAPRPGCRRGRADPWTTHVGRRRQRELGGPRPLRSSRRVQREAEQQGGVGPDGRGSAAGHPGPGAAAADDERSGQPSAPAASAPRTTGTHAASSVAGRPGHPPAGHEPRLLDERRRPTRRPTSTSRATARSRAPEPSPGAVRRARRCRGLAPAATRGRGPDPPGSRRRGRSAWAGRAHQPSTSPVIGSTTPSSSSRVPVRAASGPLLRVAPTAAAHGVGLEPTGRGEARAGRARTSGSFSSGSSQCSHWPGSRTRGWRSWMRSRPGLGRGRDDGERGEPAPRRRPSGRSRSRQNS